MSEQAGAHPLLTLLELGQRARAASSSDELAFMAVNDSRALLPYRQAALWFQASGVHTLSGVVTVEGNTPYALWIDTLCSHLARQAGPAGPRLVDTGLLPEAIRSAWDQWLPAHALWLPLPSLQRPATAPAAAASAQPAQDGLLIAGDQPWAAGELALLNEWMEIWQHAWRAAHAAPSWTLTRLPVRLRQWWQAASARQRWRRRLALLAGVLLVLLFPVRLSVLAPGELVSANPATVRAPLDGVIAEFSVRPNQSVAAGQPLFSFDQAPVGSRLEVAREALAAAQAEYRQHAQLMLNDPRSRGQLAAALGKVAEKQAQAAYLEAQAQRSRVVAPQAGIVLFDDPAEWVGRPVQTGERILLIAAENDVEVEAWVAVGDAIPLPEGAPLQLYLAASPLTPVSGTLRYMSHRAIARPDGSYAYRVRARLLAPTGQRIGLKGTARLGGQRVPLIYWMLRRPLASVRQFIAL